MTFANEKSNFNLDLEDKNTQINNVDTKIIKDFCDIITYFLSIFEFNNFN